MNRRERRAAFARGQAADAAPASIAELTAEASRARHEGRSAKAEELCRRILSRDPAHSPSLNLLGLINQDLGRHRQAVKMFLKAIDVDDINAACHYNIASSYQFLGQRHAAAAHFKKAIALGMSDKNLEDFILQNPDIAARVNRTMADTIVPPTMQYPGEREIAAIANDIFLQCALQSKLIRGVPLELFLTGLRVELLGLAAGETFASAKIGGDVAGLFCALAQQCFINEYVYACGDDEMQQACRLRELLLQGMAAGGGIPVMLLAAVAAYFPLFSLGPAPSLLAASWPNYAIDLLCLQVREPLEEADDRPSIAALTAIDDPVSIEVMQQYAQNPYPRWTTSLLAALADEGERDHDGPADSGWPQSGEDILIAGCGTGQHAFHIAERWPAARILAVDMSLPSLAYARRKTRQAKLHNIEYAQADILKLATIGKTFDRIEAVGVLHHLADPKLGWRILLSLLKPNGVLRVGLYSTAARRSIAEARALIAERGYPATPEGIRALRRTIIRNRHEQRWNLLLATADDFYSMSGCRDLFFNVMEHTFTVPDITALLAEFGLSFLGFELDADVVNKFQQRYPAASALTDLDCWNAFERSNPQTFRNMYVFSVRRNATD
jgi:2-polyprenyl-3-methyl-5-hydroxy-6-metoxy-1,4-benzoquinol methylase/tetratricopeptide (TPR) repeat protein